MASGKDVSQTPGRSRSNSTHSISNSMVDKASATLPNGEASVLNPNKKQKTSNTKPAVTYDVSATPTTTTRAPVTTTTTVPHIKTPINATKSLTAITATKATISTPKTTTSPQHIKTPAVPKQERMTAASFFEEEEIVCLGEIRGTKRRHESTEASAPPPPLPLLSTNTIAASYCPVSK